MILSNIALQLTASSAVIVALAAAVLVAVRLLDRDRRLDGGDAIYGLLSASAWVAIVLVPLLLVSVCSGFLVAPVLIGAMAVVVWRVHRARQYSLIAALAVSAERQIPLIPAVEALADGAGAWRGSGRKNWPPCSAPAGRCRMPWHGSADWSHAGPWS